MRALILIALAACGGGEEATSDKAGDKPAEATPRDAVVEAWKQGGFEATGLKATTVSFGKDCQAGTVKGVDVLLCNYASAEEIRTAEPKSAEWLKNATTATVFASGKVLVVLADNKQADPGGKTINELMKLAPKG